MLDDTPTPLDLCYPPSCVSLHALRQKRVVKILALRRAQADVVSLQDEVEYLDYRIETVRERLENEMAELSCRFDKFEDYYHE